MILVVRSLNEMQVSERFYELLNEKGDPFGFVEDQPLKVLIKLLCSEKMIYHDEALPIGKPV